MSNELAPTSLASLVPITSTEDAKLFKDVSKVSDYFLSLKMCSSKSKQVENNLIARRNYALIRRADDFDDLGQTVDVIPIAWRPKALDCSSAPVQFYDAMSPQFQKIQHEANNTKDSGCSYGPEFLVWVPRANEFALLFCNGKTSRGDSPKIRALLGKGMTLGGKYIAPTPSNKFGWDAMTVQPCNAELAQPDMELAKKAVDKFQREALSKGPVAAPETEDRPQ